MFSEEVESCWQLPSESKFEESSALDTHGEEVGILRDDSSMMTIFS